MTRPALFLLCALAAVCLAAGCGPVVDPTTVEFVGYTVGEDSITLDLPGSFGASTRQASDEQLLGSGSLTGDNAPEVVAGKATRVPISIDLQITGTVTITRWEADITHQTSGESQSSSASVGANGKARISFTDLAVGRWDVELRCYGIAGDTGDLIIVVGPPDDGDALQVTPTSLVVTTESPSATFDINTTLSWQCSTDAAWLTVSPSSGKGSDTATVSASLAGVSDGACSVVTVTSDAGDVEVTVCAGSGEAAVSVR